MCIKLNLTYKAKIISIDCTNVYVNSRVHVIQTGHI